ncbi:MAG: CHASE2 domain-containing protein [Bdellovibrionaceae bacterium]|nr:CHASE2 domain-containing protein [Bdellovibrionales bacterium]MCB9086491.1 CHASE2 domain-containing protein [Pseudobdellovibrionaceae bacterium]
MTLALGIAVLLCQFDLDYLESWTYDLRVQSKPMTPTSGHIVTIAIDPATVEALKRDPNAMDHVHLLNRLAAVHPRAVVYVNPPNEIDGTYEEMRLLGESAQTLNQFFVAANRLPIKGQEDQLRLDPPLENLTVMPGPKTSDQKIFAKDDVTRRLIFSYHNSPSLHAVLASSYNGLSHDEAKAQKLYSGLFEFLGTYQAYIDFRPSNTYKPLSFVDILQGKFQPDTFRDKIVFIGADTVMSSSDYIRTPFSREIVAMSTLEMHANMTDTLILNSAPIKANRWLDLLLTALISILTVYVVLTVRPARGLGILIATMISFSLVCYLSFVLFSFWIGMAHPLLAIFICYYFFIPYRLIMENRRSWEYYQRNRLLTQVEELKSNFLRMMSHDLKTPLARIQGMTDMVKSDNNPLSSGQKEALDRIHKSSEELSDFIGSILSLGRIESKEIKLELHSKDVNTLLAEIIQKSEYLAAKKNIKIISEFEPMFSIKLDEDLVRQVFTNLVENAIKYSPEDSKILVSTEEINGRIVVQVADQGIGIPPEDLPNVFEKFYRSYAVKNSPVKGSGLGLYLSRYFVELHRGRISVESQLGKGSTFTVELPMDLENSELMSLSH